MRESITARMKNIKERSHSPRKSLTNGEVKRDGATKRLARAAAFAHPKTELEAAVQRFTDLFDFGPIGYVTFDRVGRIEEINHAAAELFGCSRARFVGQPFALYVREEDLPLFWKHLLRCRSSNVRVETELRLKHRKGGIIIASLASSPVISSMWNGARLYQTAIVDRTERKRTEQRLLEQARLLDLSSDAILIRDPQDRIIYWNHGAHELYGYSRKEALGKMAHELLCTEGPDSLADIREKLERDNRWTGELVHTCKDGGKIVVISRWSLDRDSTGQPTSVLETNTDISDRKRVEARTAVNLSITRILAQSPALIDAVPKILQTVGETLGWEVGAFWMPTRDGSKLHCVRVWETSVDRFPEFKAASAKITLGAGIGVPGRVWSKLKTKWVSDVTKDHNFSRASVAAKEGLHGAFAFPICFGKYFLGVMEFFSSEIREPDKNLLKMFASIGSQIGQYVQGKRAEEELQQSKELLESRVRERTLELHQANKRLKSEIERRKGLEGEILSVSDREQQRLGQELHDGLCQHLTAVAFMARSMAVRLRDHRVIDVADLEKVAELVNKAATDTRNLSRALHRVDVDAASLVMALGDLANREIWRTPCRLHLRPSFHIDDDAAAAHLYRIAREAVINANKHAHASQIVVRLERSRNEMVLRVIDDGVGFPKDIQPQQGLGYHIMKYRAQLMGGRLEIDSPKGGGTCVSCYLPVETSPMRNVDHRDNPLKHSNEPVAGDLSLRHLAHQGAANG